MFGEAGQRFRLYPARLRQVFPIGYVLVVYAERYPCPGDVREYRIEHVRFELVEALVRQGEADVESPGGGEELVEIHPLAVRGTRRRRGRREANRLPCA